MHNNDRYSYKDLVIVSKSCFSKITFFREVVELFKNIYFYGSTTSLKKVILEKHDFETVTRVAIIIMHCYIPVSNNDDSFWAQSDHRIPEMADHTPSSNNCRFSHSGRRLAKLYIFEEISKSTFQKYIVFDVCGDCARRYSHLK